MRQKNKYFSRNQLEARNRIKDLSFNSNINKNDNTYLLIKLLSIIFCFQRDAGRLRVCGSIEDVLLHAWPEPSLLRPQPQQDGTAAGAQDQRAGETTQKVKIDQHDGSTGSAPVYSVRQGQGPAVWGVEDCRLGDGDILL